jgi:hypothetical protein
VASDNSAIFVGLNLRLIINGETSKPFTNSTPVNIDVLDCAVSISLLLKLNLTYFRKSENIIITIELKPGLRVGKRIITFFLLKVGATRLTREECLEYQIYALLHFL